MSRTARLWKGVGPLTLGGLLLSGGSPARADDARRCREQLIDLGRQAAAQGKADDARTFFQNALKLDPNNAEARTALARLGDGPPRRVPGPGPAGPAPARRRPTPPRRGPGPGRPAPRATRPWSARPRLSSVARGRRSPPTSASGSRRPAT